jgi:hypothetical protein
MNRGVLPAIGSKQVRDVERSDIVAVLDNYRSRGGRSTDALRSKLQVMFGYAVGLGIIDINPVQGITPPGDRLRA